MFFFDFLNNIACVCVCVWVCGGGGGGGGKWSKDGLRNFVLFLKF